MTLKDRKAVGWLGLVVLLTSLPFVQRAYFVDDYYFVTMAKGLLEHPWRPYDFKSDDAGIGNVAWERGQRPRMVNPPLFHYYLAAVMATVGDEPWKMRTASLLFSLMAVWSMYFLGKRFVDNPFLPTLLMAVCPAYWLTSYSLLIDSALIGCMLGSFLLFVVGHERRRLSWVIGSGVLMGLTMLVKYTGALVFALAFAWQCLDPESRRWKASYVAYVAGGIVLLLWGIWNIATYGQMHLFATLPRGFHSTSSSGIFVLGFFLMALTAARVMPLPRGQKADARLIGLLGLVLVLGLPAIKASSPTLWLEATYADKILVLSSFLGGGLIFMLGSLLLLAMKPRVATAMFGMWGIVLFYLFHSRFGGFAVLESVLLSLFIVGAMAFLWLAGECLARRQIRHADFLWVWLALGIAELITVMPWTAGRYLLGIVPPFAWIAFHLYRQGKKPWLWRAVLGTTAVMGLLLAHADFIQANTIAYLSERLAEKRSEFEAHAPKTQSHWYFLADTFDGAQPYIEPLGWENVLPYQSFKKGDLFLRAYYRKSSWWMVDTMRQFKPVWTIEMRSWNLFRVMDVPASAGFYASCWGALPWTITDHPLERFELYQAVSQ